jgi:transposase InsO family protein
MRAEDVTDTLDMVLAASGCNQAHVHHRPRLLSDNGPSYIAEPMMSMAPAPANTEVTGPTATPTASRPVAPTTPAKAKPAEAPDPQAGMNMNNM